MVLILRLFFLNYVLMRIYFVALLLIIVMIVYSVRMKEIQQKN